MNAVTPLPEQVDVWEFRKVIQKNTELPHIEYTYFVHDMQA